MRENEIRADDLRAEGRRLYKIDQEKMLLKKDKFVEVNCPACDKKKYNFFYRRDSFIFVKCNFCETVFVNPRPTQEMVFEHYRTSLAEKFWNENVYPQSEEARIKHIVIPRVKEIINFCKNYNIKTEFFMDVGAGCGTFCEQVKKTGKFKQVIAIEPDPSPAESCRKRSIEVVEDFIENIPNNFEKASVITSVESIEHVFDPHQYVKKIYDLLADNGLFFITAPNIKGFDLLILKDKSDNTTAPDHLNYFHPKSIKILLERCGFKVLNIQTPGKLDAELIRNKVKQGIISLDEQPFLKRILIDEWENYSDSFQKWLADNELSSHMQVVARKIKN